MKRLLFLPAAAFICACTSPPVNTEKTADNAENQCYGFISGKDSITLNIQQVGEYVEGTMRYDNHEKDGSTGTIKGQFAGDTLIFRYTFQSEGTTSVREMFFLRDDTVLREGIGDQKEANGEMVFADRSKIVFTGMVMQPLNCETGL